MSVKDARNTLIQAGGIDEKMLQTLRTNWIEIVKAGVLPSIKAKRQRGRGKLTIEDLGLPSLGSDKFRLGSKVLFPKVLKTSQFYDGKKPDRTYVHLVDGVEKAARMRLEKLCFDTPFGFFLPVKHFKEWRSLFAGYKAQAEAIVEETIEDWEDIVDAMTVEYIPEASAAYGRYCQLTGHDETPEGLASFVQRYQVAIAEQMGSAGEFQEKFAFEESYSFVPLPMMLAQEAAEAAAKIEQAELAEEMTLAEVETLRSKRIKMRQGNDGLEREIDDMRSVVMSQAKAEAQKTADQFIDGVLTQMREKIIEVAEKVQECVANNGHVIGKNRTQVRNMIDQIRSMNFVEDEQVEDMLATIENTLEYGDDKKDPVTLEDVLTDAAYYCAIQIDAIERTGRSEVSLDDLLGFEEEEVEERDLRVDDDFDLEGFEEEEVQERTGRVEAFA